MENLVMLLQGFLSSPGQPIEIVVIFALLLKRPLRLGMTSSKGFSLVIEANGPPR